MTESTNPYSWPQILKKCGENGNRILAIDWSKNSLGPLEEWPQELRQSLITCLESRFPTFLNWGPDLIQLYNDASKPILGGKHEKQALGSSVKDSYPELWEKVEPMFRAVLGSGLTTWVEDQLLVINRYGFEEETYMTWSYSPVRDSKGVIKGVITNAIETTHKVVGERRLNMLKEMATRTQGRNTIALACHSCVEVFKENENDIPFAVIRILEDSGNNARAVSSFGISVPDRGVNQNSEHYHPALSEALKTKIGQFVKDMPVDVTISGKTIKKPQSVYVLPLINKFENKNEVIGFLSVGINPRISFDNDYINFLEILSDQLATTIAGAKTQEEAYIKASQASSGEIKKLSFLIDASPDHIFIFDREGRYTYHNKATANALRAQMISIGRGDEPTLNKNGYDMEFEAGFQKRFMAAKDKAFKGSATMVAVTFPTLEGPRDFECILSPIYDEKGEITSVSGITRDVTDLKQSIKVRDEFLSIASHELKTPLTTLKLQTQMRSRTLEKGKMEIFNKEKLAKIFHDDDVQINRLNRLVDDMLDVSRLNAGRIDLHLDEVDISEVVHDVLDRLSLHLQGQNINVTLDVKSIKGKWDRYRIEQVFTNLLTNAMKYGNGKPVNVKTEVTAGNMILTVADQGMGIMPEDKTRIFKQFERAISSSSVSGLGLGLYIVKEILKSHGGKIRVESEYGVGSQFIVTLPLTMT